MSKYTTELRYICETQANQTESQPYTEVADIIAAARTSIFSFDYPYYDAEQKERTETNILRHFYTREIGEETYGLFKLRLEDKMNLIMPYYVEMFKTAALEYDPLIDVDLTETMDQDTTSENDGTVSGSSSSSTSGSTSSETTTDDDTSTTNDSTTTDHSESESSASGAKATTDSSDRDLLSKYSDTPQGAVTNLENGTYLTNARKDEEAATAQKTESDNSTNTSESDGSTVLEATGSAERDVHTIGSGTSSSETEGSTSGTTHDEGSGTLDYTKTTKGKTAGRTYSDLIQAYRNTVMRIDSMICDELEVLFMQLW